MSEKQNVSATDLIDGLHDRKVPKPVKDALRAHFVGKLGMEDAADLAELPPASLEASVSVLVHKALDGQEPEVVEIRVGQAIVAMRGALEPFRAQPAPASQAHAAHGAGGGTMMLVTQADKVRGMSEEELLRTYNPGDEDLVLEELERRSKRQNTIVFKPDGTVDVAASATLVVRAKGGERLPTMYKPPGAALPMRTYRVGDAPKKSEPATRKACPVHGLALEGDDESCPEENDSWLGIDLRVMQLIRVGVEGRDPKVLRLVTPSVTLDQLLSHLRGMPSDEARFTYVAGKASESYLAFTDRDAAGTLPKLEVRKRENLNRPFVEAPPSAPALAGGSNPNSAKAADLLGDLSEPEKVLFVMALVEAFPTPDDLAELARHGLNLNIAEVISPSDVLRKQAAALITYAQSMGWVHRLLVVAIGQRQQNESLSRLEHALLAPRDNTNPPQMYRNPDPNPDNLYDRLTRLPPGQFEDVLFRLGVKTSYLPGGSSTQAERAIALMRLIENQGKMAELETAVSRHIRPR